MASAGLKIQLKLTILTQTYWKSPLLRPLVKFQENKEGNGENEEREKMQDREELVKLEKAGRPSMVWDRLWHTQEDMVISCINRDV